jgi:hypothetical protein
MPGKSILSIIVNLPFDPCGAKVLNQKPATSSEAHGWFVFLFIN